MSNETSKVLLSTAYLAPIDYYVQLLQHEQCYIECHEFFLKQSYRNRCHIAGANGMLPLTVPIIRKSKDKTPIKDIRISYAENWQAQHWKTICAAYESSPFFEYYKDDLEVFFTEKRYEYLQEWNEALHQHICKELGLVLPLLHTESYEANPNVLDLRADIHPKKEAYSKNYQERYIQVFDSKFGFQPSLSILDLWFNEGPNAENYLYQTMLRQYPR